MDACLLSLQSSLGRAQRACIIESIHERAWMTGTESMISRAEPGHGPCSTVLG